MAMPSEIDFRVLGPLAVRCGEETVDLGGKRQQILLSMLLLEANRIVTIDRLIDAIWGEAPPLSARSQVRICVSQMRRELAEKGHGDLIETHCGSYLIRIPLASVDLHRFAEFATLGRKAARAGDADVAVKYLRMALDQWRGPLATAPAGELARSVMVKLDEDRCAVAEDYILTMLRLGRHREIVGELTGYVTEFPYRESISAQLMLALHRSGRTAEALDFYRQTRRRFIQELGIEPGQELRAMEHFVLGDSQGALPAGPPDGERAARQPSGRTDLSDRLQIVERELLEMRVGLNRLIRSVEQSYRAASSRQSMTG